MQAPYLFFNKFISIKDIISQQLNKTFYNLNILNMHDFEIYEKIRFLAY